MKTWRSKYRFTTFCKENGIDKKHPLYELFKKCYDYGERYGENFREQCLRWVNPQFDSDMESAMYYADQKEDLN